MSSSIKRKIYVVGMDLNYINWCEAEPCETMEEATAVLFSGGQDVHASLYARKPHVSAYSSLSRDKEEIAAFKKARALNKPLIGVCRGSQLLCCLAGGSLVQDQANSRFYHPIHTYDGKEIVVSSTHHQAQIPWGIPEGDFKVLGWSFGESAYHWGERDGDEVVIGVAPNDMEVDVCWYRNINAICYQNHPEMTWEDRHHNPHLKESIEWCQTILDRFLNQSL